MPASMNGMSVISSRRSTDFQWLPPTVIAATISNSANSGTTAVSGQTCAMIGTAISAEPKPETPKAT